MFLPSSLVHFVTSALLPLYGLEPFCPQSILFSSVYPGDPFVVYFTLCQPMVCSPPGSSVHSILQVRILKWVAMPSTRGSSRPRDRTLMSLMSPALAGKFFITSTTCEAPSGGSSGNIKNDKQSLLGYSPRVTKSGT